MLLDSTYAVRYGTLQLQDVSSAYEAWINIASQPRNLGSCRVDCSSAQCLINFTFWACSIEEKCLQGYLSPG